MNQDFFDTLTPKPRKRGLWKWLVLIFLLLALAAILFCYDTSGEPEPTKDWEEYGVPSWVDVQIIRQDGASRRGVKLEAVRDLAVHYVGNPGTSAQANRNYFNGPDSETSSHFIVGLSGEVILCVPLDEKSSATNHRNADTISIEVCHPDETGRFSPQTYASLVRLLSWLLEKYDLTEENLIRHYDVTGKLCPLYYVEHPEAWEELKNDVKTFTNEEQQ